MTLAQVQATAAVVMALVASWVGLTLTATLLFPARSESARAALASSPARCFWRGLALTVLIGAALVLFGRVPPLLKLATGGLVLAGAGVYSVGAAAIAALMGERIGAITGNGSQFGNLVKGGATFSFAMLFPLVGWWLIAPLSVIFSLGAGAAAFTVRKPHEVLPVPAGSGIA